MLDQDDHATEEGAKSDEIRRALEVLREKKKFAIIIYKFVVS